MTQVEQVRVTQEAEARAVLATAYADIYGTGLVEISIREGGNRSIPTNAAIAAMLAFANQQRERDGEGWQPIGTAPRDGSEIIICYSRDGERIRSVSKAKWVSAEFWADLENGDPEDFQAGWYEPDAEDELCATHWLPLPALTDPASRIGGE